MIQFIQFVLILLLYQVVLISAFPIFQVCREDFKNRIAIREWHV